MKRLIPFLFLLPLLASCNKTVFSESHTFAGDIWNRFEPEKYTFSIKNIEDYYDIVMTVEFDTNLYRGKDLPLVVNMTSQEGEQRMYYADIPLFESKSGKRVGSLEGSVQTASARVRKYLSFNRQGTYTLEVKQGTSKYQIEGIKAFGISVVKADMELPQ